MNRNDLIKGYSESKFQYEENIGRLNQMLKIVEPLNNMDHLAKEIRKAIAQGQTCIRRLNSVISALEKNDLKHINSQSKSLLTDTNRFEEMSKRIDGSIKRLKTAVMQQYSKSR